MTKAKKVVSAGEAVLESVPSDSVSKVPKQLQEGITRAVPVKKRNKPGVKVGSVHCPECHELVSHSGALNLHLWTAHRLRAKDIFGASAVTEDYRTVKKKDDAEKNRLPMPSEIRVGIAGKIQPESLVLYKRLVDQGVVKDQDDAYEKGLSLLSGVYLARGDKMDGSPEDVMKQIIAEQMRKNFGGVEKKEDSTDRMMRLMEKAHEMQLMKEIMLGGSKETKSSETDIIEKLIKYKALLGDDKGQNKDLQVMLQKQMEDLRRELVEKQEAKKWEDLVKVMKEGGGKEEVLTQIMKLKDENDRKLREQELESRKEERELMNKLHEERMSNVIAQLQNQIDKLETNKSPQSLKAQISDIKETMKVAKELSSDMGDDGNKNRLAEKVLEGSTSLLKDGLIPMAKTWLDNRNAQPLSQVQEPMRVVRASELSEVEIAKLPFEAQQQVRAMKKESANKKVEQVDVRAQNKEQNEQKNDPFMTARDEDDDEGDYKDMIGTFT